MRFAGLIAVSIITLGLSAFAASAGAPQRGYGYGHSGEGVVVAESRFGHDTVSGPVRIARAGNREVRLPGGTWLSCTRSCAETLRVESIDFWENKGAGQHNRIDNECGIFGCLGRGYRF